MVKNFNFTIVNHDCEISEMKIFTGFVNKFEVFKINLLIKLLA